VRKPSEAERKPTPVQNKVLAPCCGDVFVERERCLPYMRK
jgi:hypothetical protein